MAITKTYFPTPATPAVASYSYTDLAAGTGYVTYYLADTQSGGILMTSSDYSNHITSSGETASGGFEICVDRDFDLKFQKPQTIKGKALATFTQGVYVTGADTFHTQAFIHIRKWDGTTETNIASGASDIFVSDTGAGTHSRTECVEIQVPRTHFKRDDYLRVSVVSYGKQVSGTGPEQCGFGHDPADRNASTTFDYCSGSAVKLIEDTDTTTFKINVPFEIDVS